MVLDEQHAERGVDGGVGRVGRRLDRGGIGAGRRQPELDPERAPLAGRTLQSDPALHQLDQTTTDAQPEPGPAQPLVGIPLELGEALEDDCLLVAGDAGTRVTDGQPDGRALLGRLQQARLDDDLAVGCKLDGVRDEVREHLTDADRIAGEPAGDLGVDMARHLQPLLLGPWGQEPHDLLDESAQIEGNCAQTQLSGLDPGEVEDIVDDGQERVGTRFDGGQVVALAIVEAGLFEQLDHAHDAVHRGADLVAHVGQKGALGPGRLEGLVASPPQLFLDFPPARSATEEPTDDVVPQSHVQRGVFRRSTRGRDRGPVPVRGHAPRATA